jgi:hypothetical protein
MSKNAQLLIGFPEERHELGRQFVPTRALLKHRLCNSLFRKIFYVNRFFPELVGEPVRVGITRVASGMAVPGGNEIWLNPIRSSYHTIAHELVHLLQGRFGVPRGEKSCDLFALAKHWTLNDTPPYYLKVPAEFLDCDGRILPEFAKLIHTVAKRALDLRQSGTRNYIAFFENTVKEFATGDLVRNF